MKTPTASMLHKIALALLGRAKRDVNVAATLEAEAVGSNMDRAKVLLRLSGEARRRAGDALADANAIIDAALFLKAHGR